MALISGVRSTENVDQNRRKFDISEKLWMVDPDYAKLAFFTRKLRKVKTVDPEYRHFDYTQPSRQDAVNNAGAAYDASTTAIVVDNGNKFRAGDIVNSPVTGEQMRVTAVSSNTLTVSRGYGTTAAAIASVADNSVLVILGNANAEGAGIRTALSEVTTKRSNYTQIFREPIDITETAAATEVYAGGSDLADLRRTAWQLHMKDVERSFLFGEAKEDITSTAAPIRTTGGAKSYISTNVKTIATLTEAEWEDWIADMSHYGEDKKMVFTAPLIASAVNSWAKNKLQTYPKDKTYGIAITNYLSIHGEIDFTIEKILSENPVWAGMAFAFEMDKLAYRYLSGNGINRDTRLLKNRQANDADQIKEEYLSEIGFELFLENRHGLLKGVTAYS